MDDLMQERERLLQQLQEHKQEPDVLEKLIGLVGGRPRGPAANMPGGAPPSYGQNPAPEGWDRSAPFDIRAFLAQHGPKNGSVGGGSAGISFAGVDKASEEDRKRALDMIARIQSGRTAQGALEAARPLTKAFDSEAADAQLRRDNVEQRPDNTGFQMWQNAPMWVGGEKGFATRGDPNAAARIAFDIDKRSETSHEAKLARLLGQQKEKTANENMTAKELHDRLLAPILAQIPNALEVGVSKDLSRSDLERSKLSAAAQVAASRGQRDTQNEEKLKFAAELLQAGKITPDEFLGLKKQLAFGAPAPGMKMGDLKDLNEMAGGNPALMRVFADYQSGAFGPPNDPKTNQRLAIALAAAQEKK